MYIYDLPYEDRKKLCFILDQNDQWEQLGLEQMQYDEITIDNIRKKLSRGKSASNELLTLWGNLNHTVLELFILLERMGLYQAMSVLKHFVEDKYRSRIKEDNLNADINRLHINNSKIPTVNYDKNTIKNTAITNSDENNESHEVSETMNNPSNLQANNNLAPQLQVPKDSTKTITAYMASSVGGGTPQIPYDELDVATDGWDPSRILGQGGYGTVFKGTWKWTQVAIKRLEIKENTRKDVTEQIRQSMTELHCLNAYRHDNILPLYGYSIGGPHPCLVYQYMLGGSLDGRIRTRDQTKVLSWPCRLKVAIGTARGLQFLHTTLHGNKPLIHGDIKSANILLDAMDQPRIGDFGLAREGPEIHYTHIQVTRVHGTVPYLPDEFLRSKQFSTRIDTYSFGVVLFELATARPPASEGKRFLKDLVVKYPEEKILELKDPKAGNEVEGDFVFEQLIRIGKLCVQKRAKDRPEMVTVLLELEKVAVLVNRIIKYCGHSKTSTLTAGPREKVEFSKEERVLVGRGRARTATPSPHSPRRRRPNTNAWGVCQQIS